MFFSVKIRFFDWFSLLEVYQTLRVNNAFKHWHEVPIFVSEDFFSYCKYSFICRHCLRIQLFDNLKKFLEIVSTNPLFDNLKELSPVKLTNVLASLGYALLMILLWQGKFADVSHMFRVFRVYFLNLCHSETVIIVQPCGYIFISTFALLSMCAKHKLLLPLRWYIIFNNILRLNHLLLINRTEITFGTKVWKFQPNRCW